MREKHFKEQRQLYDLFFKTLPYMIALYPAEKEKIIGTVLLPDNHVLD